MFGIRKINKQSHPLFKCDLCSTKFKKKFNYVRHKTALHPTIMVLLQNGIKTDFVTFECSSCQKKFNRKDSLIRHIYESCNKSRTEEKPVYECSWCGQKLHNKFSIIRHLKARHQNSRSAGKINCVFCGWCSGSTVSMQSHYAQCHNQVIENENLKFTSRTEFDNWKYALEVSIYCNFIRRHYRKSTTNSVTLFRCHRSGPHKPATAHTKRRIKLQGSKKISGLCPAEIKLVERYVDGVCEVRFTKTHVGHGIETKDELKHVYLTKHEKSLGIVNTYLKREQMDVKTRERGKVLLKLQRLRSYHNAIENLENINDYITKCENPGIHWLVQSSQIDDSGCIELYTVQNDSSKCREGLCPLLCEKCDLCFHQYKCSCDEYFLRNDMCEHIHILGLHLKSISNSQPLSPDFPPRHSPPSHWSSPQITYTCSPPSPRSNNGTQLRETAVAFFNRVLPLSCNEEEATVVLKYMKKAEAEIMAKKLVQAS